QRQATASSSKSAQTLPDHGLDGPPKPGIPAALPLFDAHRLDPCWAQRELARAHPGEDGGVRRVPESRFERACAPAEARELCSAEVEQRSPLWEGTAASDWNRAERQREPLPGRQEVGWPSVGQEG